METAVRLHLGFARASALERKFRGLVPALREVSENGGRRSSASDLVRDLMIALVEASRDLNSKGVDRRGPHADRRSEQHRHRTGPGPIGRPIGPSLPHSARASTAFASWPTRETATRQRPGCRTLYFEDFEAVERVIQSRRPQDIRPLEETYSAIRGEVGSGTLKGQTLATRLDGLQADVEPPLSTACRSSPRLVRTGLRRLVRDGPSRRGRGHPAAGDAGRPGGEDRADRGDPGDRLGRGLAVLASAATAVGLNFLVASAQGRAREVIEGGVMLAAAAVLFYVSYWLISQSESKRWMRSSSGRRSGASGAAAMLRRPRSWPSTAKGPRPP